MEPAQVTALLLKKCRQPLSSQSTICQRVFAIKVHNHGDDSLAQKRKEARKEKSVHWGQDGAAPEPVEAGLKSNKDLLAAQERVCKVRGTSQLHSAGDSQAAAMSVCVRV